MSRQRALLRLSSLKRAFSTCSALEARGPVQLTSERYPNLKRGDFASLTSDDIKTFQSILDPGESQDVCLRLQGVLEKTLVCVQKLMLI